MYESIHEWPLYRTHDVLDGGRQPTVEMDDPLGDRQNLGSAGDLGEYNCDGQKRSSFGILT